MAIRIHGAALRHRVSEERIRHVIRECPYPLYSDEPGEEDLVIYLGADPNGVLLEVMAVELENDDLLVIHAMKMRHRYDDDFERVMEQSEQ